MDRGKKVVGLLLIFVSAAALITWEKWGKDRFLYDDILVLNQNVNRGTTITEEMLEVRRTDVREADCLTPEQLQTVIGREAAFFVHKNVPLFAAYFTENGMTADAARGRYLLQIPGSWVTNFPPALQKGDRVHFFSGGSLLTSAVVYAVEAERSSFIAVVDKDQAAELTLLGEKGSMLTVIYD